MIRLPDPVSAAALGYLALPTFVFLLGWLQPVLALPIVALLSVVLYRQVTRFPRRRPRLSRNALYFLLFLAPCWSAFGGAGHLFYANVDWRTRDTIYADLFLTAWPPSYGLVDGAPLLLRTAMGYFLPPAALVKLVGIASAPYVLLTWTAIGVALFLMLLPLPCRFGWRMVLVCLTVVFFSGMDFIGILLVNGHFPIFPLPLEWWLPWTYTSLTAQLFWAPNHALALWLGTALFYRHRNAAWLPSLALTLLPLLMLWTPFAVLGLLPWIIWGVWHLKAHPIELLRTTDRWQWLLAALLLWIIGGLLSSSGVAAQFSTPSATGSVQRPDSYVDLSLFLHYIQFAGFEFMLLSIALLRLLRRPPQELALAAGLLAVLPMVRFGPSNDWILRVSTPSLVILLLITIGILRKAPEAERGRRKRLPLVAILAAGAITPGFEFARAIVWPRTPPNYSVSLIEQQKGFLAPHYLGRLARADLQAIFKPSSPVPAAWERLQRLAPEIPRKQ